jgi:hypothetical protein
MSTRHKWESDGIELPHAIEQALKNDKLVLFCGAGVSAAPPSNLPGFRGLVEKIAGDLGRPELLPADPNIPVQFDVVMGELDELQHDVHARVTAHLKSTVSPNSYHRDLLQIFSTPGRAPRIVTTNFDLLFEEAARGLQIPLATHIAPALPLGDDFDGLVHLHGPVAPSPRQRMVVTDSDFGSAYIVEGWATQFLSRMFARYTVLFIGYSADDTVLRYLARALPRDGDTRFAFMAAEEGSVMGEKWQRLGVQPVPFPSPVEGPYESLKNFVGHWRERSTATAADKFDRVEVLVAAGPENLAVSDSELLWIIGDPEHARHFRNASDPTVWLQRLDQSGFLDDLFEITPFEDEHGWAAWAGRSLEMDHGEALIAAISRHKGTLSPALWFQIWFFLYKSYEPTTIHRQLLLLLAAEQPARERGRLSGLLQVIAEKDVSAAEALLQLLLTPRLTFRHNAWRIGGDSLESDLVLEWHESSVRDAWSSLLPALTDPDHLLSMVVNLIRTAEATDALYSGHDGRFILSARRHRVDGGDHFHRDDPYVLVVDIARDLLREFVRTEGPQRAMSYLDASSEMIQRLAIDALAEAKSSEADSLVDLIIERDLVFGIATKPETFRLMRVMYSSAGHDAQQRLLSAIESSNGSSRRSPVTDYDRFNVLVWLSDGASKNDPVRGALDRMQATHDFAPRKQPDVDYSLNLGAVERHDPQAHGRFRDMLLADVVSDLAADPTVGDAWDSGPAVRELMDYFEHAPGREVEMLTELTERSIWSSTLWSTTLASAIRIGNAWTAEPLLEKLGKLPSGIDIIARGLVYTITNPSPNREEPLENANERCRLLLGMWRLVPVESSDGPPTDPTSAHSTARGSLAHCYVETTIRVAQEQGQAEIPQEGLAGFSEILEAQTANIADPSSMLLACYASHIQALATEWFNLLLRPKLQSIEESTSNISLWAGILTGNSVTAELMICIRDAVRVGWPQIARSLPGSREAFIEIHAAQFVDFTAAEDFAWADAFVATAPVATRARWIRAIARRVDGRSPGFENLLFAHWQHRVDGQPPVLALEQRALLDWVTLPGIDVERAADMFVSGPAAEVEVNGFDYYDLDDFHARSKRPFLRVASHLLDGRSTLPTFLALLVEAAESADAADSDVVLEIWSKLLALGYTPARNHLKGK